jgi:hypothetical protein
MKRICCGCATVSQASANAATRNLPNISKNFILALPSARSAQASATNWRKSWSPSCDCTTRPSFD